MTEELQTLTVPEAAELLRLNKVRLYALIRIGKIPAIRLGRSVRIRLRALRQWMEQNEQQAQRTDEPPSRN